MFTALRDSFGFDLILRTYAGWREDGVPRLAAALSYYTAFSLAPLLVIILAIFGVWLDRSQLQDRIIAEIATLVGEVPAQAIRGILEQAAKPNIGFASTVIGGAVLLFGATGVFVELKGSLNLIWKVKAPSGLGLWALIRNYFAPLSMTLGIGFLLLVSLVLSTATAAITGYFGNWLPVAAVLIQIGDQAVSFALFSLLFALIYKILPDVDISWREVWMGAALAALLFSVGRFLIGAYLGRTAFASSYGAAGSFAVILAWVYYSAQILLIGAEFTRALAERCGHSPAPRNASATPMERAMHGADTRRSRPPATGQTSDLAQTTKLTGET